MALFQMDWICVYIDESGILVERDGIPAFVNSPVFSSIDDAEQWLQDQDERANCAGYLKDFDDALLIK